MTGGGGEPLRLLLVEDHDSFRQALAFIFDRQPDFTVAAQARSVAQARERLGGIDVAVLDLVLPDGSGTEVIQDLRRENPEALILVLSASLAPGRFKRTVELGADGVLDKLASVREILDAVRRLRAGEALLWPEEVREMLRQFAGRAETSETAEAETSTETSTNHFAPDEVEALRALADGEDSEGVAARLGVAVGQGKDVVRNAMDKLGANSRLQAVALAARRGLVDIG